MDACTVTAFDVITAFAVSNPSLLLAELAGFFGLERSTNHFIEQSPSLFRTSYGLLMLVFSTVEESQTLVMFPLPAPARESEPGRMYRYGLRCNHCFRSLPPRLSPRRACRFFRVGGFGKLLCLTDHSAYFGSDAVYFV